MILRSTLTTQIAFLGIIILLFFPVLAILRPLHIGLLVLLTLLPFMKFQTSEIFSVLLIILFSYISCLITYDLINGMVPGFIWNSLPLILTLLSFLIFSKLDLTVTSIYRLVFLLLILSVFFIVIQVAFPKSIIMAPYLSLTIHAEALERFTMIIAPIGNPNNTGFLFAITIILAQICKRITPKKRKTLDFLSVILFIGIVFCFARTVMGGLFAFMVIYYFRKLFKEHLLLSIILTVAFILIGAINYEKIERFLIYFQTILTFYNDKSFIARFHNWIVVYDILMEYPLGLITGLNQNEILLQKAKGDSILDSNYLYYFMNYGMLFFLINLVYLAKKSFSHTFYFAFSTFLLITSITLPFMSDYRLGMMVGMVFALANKIISIEKNKVFCSC